MITLRALHRHRFCLKPWEEIDPGNSPTERPDTGWNCALSTYLQAWARRSEASIDSNGEKRWGWEWVSAGEVALNAALRSRCAVRDIQHRRDELKLSAGICSRWWLDATRRGTERESKFLSAKKVREWFQLWLLVFFCTPPTLGCTCSG